MSERQPLLPTFEISVRRAVVVLGVVCLLVVPTGAAFINANGLFTGPESKIQIEKTDHPNSEYVEITSNRQLTINITEDNENLSASGVNLNAETDFDQLFRITNTDNDSRQIWATYSNQGTISFYVESSDNPELIGENLANNVTLGPDESIVVSMRIDTTDNVPVSTLLTTDLYIGDKEPAPEAVITGPDTVKDGNTIELSGTPSTGVDLRYSWTIIDGGGTLSDADTVLPTYQAPSVSDDQLVTVRLTVTDADGRTDTAIKRFEVIGNDVPTPDAGGPYQVTAGESIRLDGRESSDPDGTITAYAWSIDGEIGTLTNPGQARPRFRAPSDLTENTTVTVELTVTDNDSTTSTTTTTVSIITNRPPSINAGGPYRAGSNETISLADATATDPDGEIVAYNWTIVSGGGSLADTRTLTPRYTAPTVTEGNRTIQLRVTVTDDDGATTTTTTTVTVTPNAPPRAELGGPYTVAPGGTVELSETEFNDPDGEITDRTWSITTGPGSLSDTDSDTPIYNAPAAITENTTVAVEVRLTDDSGATTTANTTITIVPTNQPPIVKPGGPYTVETGSQLLIDELNATDPDGTITEYSWTIVAGDGSLSEADSPTPIYDAPASLTSNTTVRLNVTVTDNDGASTTKTVEVGVFEPGTEPDIQLSRSTIRYPEIGKGLEVTGSDYTVTITNNGTAPLMINRTTIVGSGSDQFQIVTELPERMIIGVGQSRRIEVKFAPTRADGFEPDLQFQSNDPDEPIKSVRLQGTALPPLINIETDQLDFGNVSASGSKTLNLTVSNPSESPADLRVGTTTIVGRNPGDFEITAGGAPFTLEPGESRDIQVRYSPQTTGIRTAQLRIRSDARSAQIDVWLSNSEWWVKVEDVSANVRQDSNDNGNTDGGAGGNTAGRAKGARVTGNNIPPGVGMTVNTSVPSVENEQAFVKEATVVPNTKVGARANFNVDFLHNEDGPPTADGERYNVTANRTTLEYISVQHDIPNEKLASNSMTFRVDKTDLPADMTRDELAIEHKVDGEWVTEEATFVKESGNSLVYRITTSGFSQFVITGPNQEPTADAGDDVSIPAGGSIQLDGSGSSDPDGDIVEYSWEIINGPGSLFRHSTASPSYVVTASAGQSATVRLTVTDNSGATATDTITIDITQSTTQTPTPGPSNGTGSGGGGGAGTPGLPTGTPTGSDTGTPAGTPSGETAADVTDDGVSIDFENDDQPGDQSLSDVISISDVPLAEDGEGSEGPTAKIRPGFSGETGTQSVTTNDSGVSLAVASDDTGENDIDLKGADALTLVNRPIPLDGSHSLFASKESIQDNWQMVRQVEITVPEEYRNRSAVLTITVSKSRFGETDPEDAVIARQNNGWSLLSTDVVDQSGDTVVLQARTPGFSRFAVFAQNSVTYSWAVETYEGPLTGPSIEPTFDEPGFYNATLTVTDAFGRTDTANFTILANDVPEVAIQWDAGTVPTNQTIVMDATVDDELGNITYIWRFPDGTEKTGKRVNHTLPPNASGRIVVIAQDEFGAQGRDSIRVGSTSDTYSVEVLSYNLQIDQDVLWFLLAVLALLALFALLRWLGVLRTDDHPPEIEAFATPEADLDEQWIIIPELEISDAGEDLETITTSILLDDEEVREEIRVVGHEEGTFEADTGHYHGDSVVVSVDPDERLIPEATYIVKVTVTDEAGAETVADHPVPVEDEFVFVGERTGPELRPSYPERDGEPGDD